ncbi:retroviral-like aspartic protease [Pseudanabaenaceae cyanobacterium LEGE 13415]|nr:retroviral-like aspartic protease [Pseudanabaenaceae cyanobacterium LEGE 13415]
MTDSQLFPFVEGRDAFGDIDAVSRLPLTLRYHNSSVEVAGLVDTGSSVNVLPFQVGIELGAVWSQNLPSLRLSGNLAPAQAKAIKVLADIGSFSAIEMVFAWSQADDVPLILGRMNFFLMFDVCFYRSQMLFEIRPTLRA